MNQPVVNRFGGAASLSARKPSGRSASRTVRRGVIDVNSDELKRFS